MDEAIKWDGQTVLEISNKCIAGGFKDTILELSVEAYQILKSGFRLSPIILSGEALHRLNCEIILQYAKFHGSIEYEYFDVEERKRKREILLGEEVRGDFVKAFELLDRLTLCSGIHLLKDNNFIDENTFLEMHALRHLRNSAVHKLLLPRLDPHNPKTSLSGEEIKDIINNSLIKHELPLKYRQYSFEFEIKKKEKRVFIVDQEKLRVEIEKADPDLWNSIISLAILLSIFRGINLLLPFKR